MDRLISEKAVLDAVDKVCRGSVEYRVIYDRCEELIKAIPSAEPSGDLISRQAAIKAIDEKAKRIKNADTLNGLAGAVGILFDLPSVKPQEPKYCDRNICLKNEYNGIGCDECEVTKSQEPQKSKVDDWRNSKPLDDALNKIRAEILLRDKNVKDVRTDGHCFFTADEILEIIDKYKAESEQEPKTGHWIKYGKLYQCSECKELSCCQGKFCNECGARMVEPTCDTCEYTTAAFNPCNACKDKSEYKPQESEDKG